jgi:DNA repair exonuclease SbcCD ATPase subunit
MLQMVHGTNFRSYQNVKMEFGTHRVSVVFGDSQSDYADSNGTGKTSLMYLVLWTLFGKWPGMENADSCVRQPVNKDCSGSVWITKPGGVYTISRYRKHSEHGNNVFIRRPDKDGIQSGDLKVMNEAVENILGMNYETFVRTMVFTGAESQTFALMTDKEQKSLLDTIVPFDFSGLHERAKAKWKFAMETEIECNGVSKAIDAWIAKNETAMLELDQRRTEIRGEDEDDIWEKIHTLDEHLATYRLAVTSAEHERRELRPKMDATNDAVEKYKPVIQQFEEAKDRWIEFNAATEMLTRQETERKNALEWVDRDITNENQRLQQDSEGRLCHTCGQPLGEEALQKALASTQNELKRLNEKKLDIIRSYDKTQQHYLARQTKTGLNEETAAKLLVDYKAAHAHMKSLEQQQSDLIRQDRDLANRVESNKEQIERGEAVKVDLEAALKPDTEAIEQIAKDIDRLENETRRLKEDRKASANNQEQWAGEKTLWDNVASMFGGGKGSLQHFMFEALLPEMTATAQMCLSLFSKDELRVAFKSHKKKGSKTVEGFYVEASKGDQTTGYGDLSGGERRRIDFCIFLTLHLMASKHVFNSGVLFLDEIADFMDDTGQQAVVEVLEFFCQQYGVSCLLLTNKRELVASVAHGYRCTMADGISSLVSVQET